MERQASGVEAISAPDAPRLIEASQRAKKEGWHWEGNMASEGEVTGLIYALLLATKPEIVVETGTFLGNTTQSMAEALEMNKKGHLWTVENDPALANYYKQTKLARTTFVDANTVQWAEQEAPEDIDFAFVDCGDPPVRLAVVRSLLPKMRDDGLLLVHDTHYYDDFLAALKDILGAPQLNLRALHGLAIWQI